LFFCWAPFFLSFFFRHLLFRLALATSRAFEARTRFWFSVITSSSFWVVQKVSLSSVYQSFSFPKKSCTQKSYLYRVSTFVRVISSQQVNVKTRRGKGNYKATFFFRSLLHPPSSTSSLVCALRSDNSSPAVMIKISIIMQEWTRHEVAPSTFFRVRTSVFARAISRWWWKFDRAIRARFVRYSMRILKKPEERIRWITTLRSSSGASFR
jgi:hypothetical protein